MGAGDPVKEVKGGQTLIVGELLQCLGVAIESIGPLASPLSKAIGKAKILNLTAQGL